MFLLRYVSRGVFLNLAGRFFVKNSCEQVVCWYTAARTHAHTHSHTRANANFGRSFIAYIAMVDKTIEAESRICHFPLLLVLLGLANGEWGMVRMVDGSMPLWP
jgi:hypothetical protein